MPKPLDFDSAQWKARDAEEIWRESLKAVCEIERPVSTPLSAKLSTWNLGGTILLVQHTVRGEVKFRRTAQCIASSCTDQYLVHCLVGGDLISEAGNEEQDIRSNSIVIRDMSIPVSGRGRDLNFLSIAVARSALDRRLPEGSRLHGTVFEAGDSIGTLVVNHIKSLAAVATRMSDEEAQVAAGATLDLLVACLLPEVNFGKSRSAPRVALMLRIQAIDYIERHLFEPDLDVNELIGALKISRTQLYALFNNDGGIARYVRNRRLDEAYRRLVSPLIRRTRIAEIAYSTGFSSETTFNRVFRERFGGTPGDVRAKGLSSPQTLIAQSRYSKSLPDEFNSELRKFCF